MPTCTKATIWPGRNYPGAQQHMLVPCTLGEGHKGWHTAPGLSWLTSAHEANMKALEEGSIKL